MIGPVIFIGILIGVLLAYLWHKIAEDEQQSSWASMYSYISLPSTSHMIIGFSDEIVHHGRLTTRIVSLWQNTQGNYTVVELGELIDRKHNIISREKAIKFISRHAPPHLAKGLLRDWFGILSDKDNK